MADGQFSRKIAQIDALLDDVEAARGQSVSLAAEVASKVSEATYTAGQAAQDTAIAGKVDTATFDANKIYYEDTGQIRLDLLTWTPTASGSGMLYADLYETVNIDVITSVIITSYGAWKNSEMAYFNFYIPSSVSGMHKIRGICNVSLAGLASHPYVNLRVFGYGHR